MLKRLTILLLVSFILAPVSHTFAREDTPWYRTIGISLQRDGMFATTYHTTGDIWWGYYGPSYFNEGNSIHRYGYSFYAQADVYKTYYVKLGFRLLNQPDDVLKAHYTEYGVNTDGESVEIHYASDISDMADLAVIDIFGGYRYPMHKLLNVNFGIGVSWFRSNNQGKALFGGFADLEFKPIPMVGFSGGIKFAQKVRFSETQEVVEETTPFRRATNTIHLEWDSWCYYFGMTVYPGLW